ncbi:MAG: hypothetical protein CVT64_10550 [Actinobacteria bacterium HGW-Actinobacteria-4]|nr:MAG: hypothetical protein CVT64_10550 [Actinobacteria bacterium HGW-Actinobacteria-4]
MVKQWSFWIPLTLSIIAVVTLGIAVDDPFGTSLAPFVQGASALILVGATVSYVAATYSLAETAERQLALAQSTPALEAVDAVWRAYAGIAVSWIEVNVSAGDYIDKTLADINAAGARRTAFRTSAESLASFEGILTENRHLLPPEVKDTVNAFSRVVAASRRAALALDDALWNEITAALPKTPSKSNIRRAWREDPRLDRKNGPSWDDYMGTAWTSRSLIALAPFAAACDNHLPKFDSRARPTK